MSDERAHGATCTSTERCATAGTLTGGAATTTRNGRVRQLPVVRRVAGVTLIELMIVVVIIAILGLVAVPSYRQYMKRTHRTEAKSALLQLQTNQERWYLQNNTYTDDPENLGFVGDATENGVYTLSIAAIGSLVQGYTATAKPTSGGGSNGINMSDDDDCTEFSITSQGVRNAVPDAQGKCW